MESWHVHIHDEHTCVLHIHCTDITKSRGAMAPLVPLVPPPMIWFMYMYSILYVYVVYIAWFIYMLYTVHVHKPGDIVYIVQYITWFMYSIPSGLCTCTVHIICVCSAVYIRVCSAVYIHVIYCTCT